MKAGSLVMLLLPGMTDEAIAQQSGVGYRSTQRRVAALMAELDARRAHPSGGRTGRVAWLRQLGTLAPTFPVFVHYGVGLWVPEVGGAVDPGSDAHDLVMALYGGMSKGERNRIKIRVRSAMKAQTELEGRYLGGRPPLRLPARRRRTTPQPLQGRRRQTAP